MVDGRVNELESGEGPWLVLLHGLAGMGSVWRPVIGLLEKHFRVLVLTLPGHDGGPALPNGRPVSVAVIADAIAARLRARGIESAHIAGNSLGGWLALELARRGLARSVTALSPAGGWQSDADYMKVARPFRLLAGLLPWVSWLLHPLLQFARFRRVVFAQTMVHGERVSPAEARRFLGAFRRCVILRDLLTGMRGHGPIEPLPVMGIPIVVAWSEHDEVIPFDVYGRPLLGAVPGAVHEVVAGAGHVPMYDAPERVAALIRDTAADARTVSGVV